MKRTRLFIFSAMIIIIVILTLSGCDLIRKIPTEADKSIVAKVDGEAITKEEFDKTFEVFKTKVEMKQGSDIWDKDYKGRKYIDLAKEDVLEQMIQEKIQLKKADEMQISVTEEEVDAEYDKFKKIFNSDEKFAEFLTNLKVDEEYFKNSISRNLIISKLKENMTKNIEISEEEIAAFYNSHLDMFYRVKASHILLETEDEAKKILERVKAGEDFNKLAREYSTDPSVAENGGDLGYFRYGDMVEEFETAAFALKPGEISEVVKSQYGYHIIKVDDKKIDKFEDVKDELKSNMIMGKKNEDYNKVLEEMYSKAKIEKFTENL